MGLLGLRLVLWGSFVCKWAPVSTSTSTSTAGAAQCPTRFLERMIVGLKQNITLTTLSLSGQPVGSLLPALAESMRLCPIASLDLSRTGLGHHPAAIPTLCEVLRTNTRLTALTLSHNACGNTMLGLGPGLLKNSTLVHFDISHCCMADAAVRELVVLLRANYRLQSVLVEGNDDPLHPLTLDEIEGLLARNQRGFQCTHQSATWTRCNDEREQVRDLSELRCDHCDAVMAHRTIIDKDGTRRDRFKREQDLIASKSFKQIADAKW